MENTIEGLRRSNIHKNKIDRDCTDRTSSAVKKFEKKPQKRIKRSNILPSEIEGLIGESGCGARDPFVVIGMQPVQIARLPHSPDSRGFSGG
jgi:hypothetical protein